jgi:hypothetical protein
MVEAMIYMFFVGMGLSGGIAAVGLVTWKIMKRESNKPMKKKKRGIV